MSDKLLFDLNKYLPFYIDDDMRRKLCFSETLLISCLHNKIVKPPEKIKRDDIEKENEDNNIEEEHDDIESITQEEQSKTSCEDDFNFYFYDKDGKEKKTCRDSVIFVNGLPSLNPKRLRGNYTKGKCTDIKKKSKEFSMSSSTLSNMSSDISHLSDPNKWANAQASRKNRRMLCKCSTDENYSVCKCSSNIDMLIQQKSLTKKKSLVSREDKHKSIEAEKCECASNESNDACVCSSEKSITISEQCKCVSNVVTNVCECISEEKSNLTQEICECVSDVLNNACTCTSEDNIQVNLNETCECGLNVANTCTCTPEDNDIIFEAEECMNPLITTQNSTTTGGMTISVQAVGFQNKKLQIFTSSQYTEDGCDTGGDLLSVVDVGLHTLEETKSEHKMLSEADFTEKKYYLSLNEIGYHCIISQTDSEVNSQDTKFFTFEEAHDFLLNGALIVLLRYFAITKFQGSIITKHLKINGEISVSTLSSKIVDRAIVNNTEMPVMKVFRKMVDENEYITSECYILTLSGYLVQRQFSYSKYVLHINPLLKVNPETLQLHRQIPLRENWKEDMQLFADYLDFKDRRLMENESYLVGKTQLQAMLTDYFQTILLMKPREVLPFTRCYFSSFEKSLAIPHNAYFEKYLQHVRYSCV